MHSSITLDEKSIKRIKLASFFTFYLSDELANGAVYLRPEQR